MRSILDHPSRYLKVKDGGQRLRTLYRQETLNFDTSRISSFALSCVVGVLQEVKKYFGKGQDPDLHGTETSFEFGYATLVVYGAQRVQEGVAQHYEIMEYLISQGLPLGSQDIVGSTALHHLVNVPVERSDLVRLLLTKGANANHRNRYGEVPLFAAFQLKLFKSADILLEFGADLDVAEADGITPRQSFIRCGPEITAVVSKWLRRRSGEEEGSRAEKACGACGRNDVSLMNCMKCQVMRYCSAQCQRQHWPVHKTKCQPFAPANTVLLKPYFEPKGADYHMRPLDDLLRQATGLPTEPLRERETRPARIPRATAEGDSKPLIIKIQASVDPQTLEPLSGHDFLVYTKKRDLVCRIRREDNGIQYDKIAKVVKEKGVQGTKIYLAAELESRELLSVKTSEVLEVQPF
ncbi:ankyrin [Armillaria solidipes]|uniref:Ankyrin n=1 Tax=Armillaria solidipes TaxID=1076256 RepID=A0A2H3BMJ2_9AGAR|nr:ankyrin [Armillaria solidipes]